MAIRMPINPVGKIVEIPLIDKFIYLSTCDGSTSYQPIELVFETNGLNKFKPLIVSNEQFAFTF
jgi:hypothetical protein